MIVSQCMNQTLNAWGKSCIHLLASRCRKTLFLHIKSNTSCHCNTNVSHKSIRINKTFPETIILVKIASELALQWIFFVMYHIFIVYNKVLRDF